MEDFVKYLVAPLLSKPEELVITTGSYSVTIKVAQEDMGRIIGKSGVIINSLRNLVRLYCTAQKIPFTNLSLQQD